jgi:hypothetical protein
MLFLSDQRSQVCLAHEFFARRANIAYHAFGAQWSLSFAHLSAVIDIGHVEVKHLFGFYFAFKYVVGLIYAYFGAYHAQPLAYSIDVSVDGHCRHTE